MRNKLSLIIFILILSIFIFTGCTNKKENTNKLNKTVETEKNVYLKYVKKLKKVKESSEDLPFTVEIKYEKMDDEVRYQVIIDNPTTEIKDISALSIHNMQTDDIFPSVGIFDDKIDLIPDKRPSGVILVGYLPYDGELEDLNVQFKVLISYKIDNNKYTSYYVTKK